MNKTIFKLAKKAKDLDKIKFWTKEKPHFDGIAPHRFQAFASEYINKVPAKEDVKVCIYCLCPQGSEVKT